MNVNKNKKNVPIRRLARRKGHGGNGKGKLPVAILRSFLAGIGSATLILCLLSLVFANSGLPLNWLDPAACGAAAVGTFVSGLVLSRSVVRFRLLMGVGCGVFYCLCAVVGSFLSARIPAINEANLSLLAVLMLGAVAGSAAGALHKDGNSFAGVR